jgi:5'-3' exonuclease
MARTLLAVDLSYQVYRASAAHPMLTSRRVFTGGLFGFMTTLAKMVRETRASEVVFCQDRKPYLRSKTYPEYKQIRKQNRDDELLKMYTQSMSLVLEVLEALGFEPWGLEGFESDDMIAHIATKYRHRYDWIYAASNDSDLFQLLDAPNFAIYSKSITDITTGKSLLQRTGLTPQQFMLMTALTGTHNDIAGIDRVGPVTAKKAVLEPSLMREQRSKHAAVIDRNLGLIKLPHAEFPHSTRLPLKPNGFNSRTLYKCLGVYDIDVTNSMVQAFEQIT